MTRFATGETRTTLESPSPWASTWLVSKSWEHYQKLETGTLSKTQESLGLNLAGKMRITFSLTSELKAKV